MEHLKERLILGLLHAKREIKGDNLELVEELHELQRELEADYDEYALVLSDEYSVESGWKPEENND